MIKVKAHITTDHYKTTLSNERHELIADEPLGNGGANLGFSPSELLCNALAACTCITLRMYADKKQWPLRDVKVEVELERNATATDTTIKRHVELFGDLTAEQRERLLAIANLCLIHKTLTNPIHIETILK